MATSQSELKVYVCGNGGVGKSSFVIRICCNQFVEEYDPTIEDIYRHRFTSEPVADWCGGDGGCSVEFYDTAYQEDYGYNWSEKYLEKCDGVVFIFSLNDPMSLTDINGYIEKVLRIRDIGSIGFVPSVLIGNKMDLEQTISQQELTNLIERYELQYFEVSAKMNQNVTEAVEWLIIEILKGHQYDEPPKANRKGCFVC